LSQLLFVDVLKWLKYRLYPLPSLAHHPNLAA